MRSSTQLSSWDRVSSESSTQSIRLRTCSWRRRNSEISLREAASSARSRSHSWRQSSRVRGSERRCAPGAAAFCFLTAFFCGIDRRPRCRSWSVLRTRPTRCAGLKYSDPVASTKLGARLKSGLTRVEMLRLRPVSRLTRGASTNKKKRENAGAREQLRHDRRVVHRTRIGQRLWKWRPFERNRASVRSIKSKASFRETIR